MDEVNFGNVSVSDSCVTNIFNIIFNKEYYKGLKKSIANAINRNTSSLRKRILNDICKYIKVTKNQFYHNKVWLRLRQCQKHFNVSLCNPSDDTNHIDSNTAYINKNSGIKNNSLENCTSYSDHT